MQNYGLSRNFNSSDLASSAYFLYSNMKKWRSGSKFDPNDKVKQTLILKDCRNRSERIQKIEERWIKCITER